MKVIVSQDHAGNPGTLWQRIWTMARSGVTALAAASMALALGAAAGDSPPGTGGDPATDPVEPGAVATITIHHPLPGAVFVAPARIVFEATAVDPAGDIRLVEFFANDRSIGESRFLAKIAVIPGNPIPHRLVWEQVPPGDYTIQARAVDTLGNPVKSEPLRIRVEDPPVPVRPLVGARAVWKFSNDGTDLGTAWREPGYEDAAWKSGPAQLGYGDGDEATRTRESKPPHPMTAYFRHAFEVEDPATIPGLIVRLVRDDGAAVYLNGQEILRDNLPEGPLAFATPASGGAGENENAVRAFEVPAAALVKGRNVVAVEVHQVNPESSDLSFALELLAGDPAPVASLRILEPAEGATFPAGTALPILAVAVGPDTLVGVVEFYAGDTLLGKSSTPTSPPDGGPVLHRFIWEAPPAGIHKLTARTRPDAAGQVLVSPPVTVVVKGVADEKPVVRIQAVVGETMEPSPHTKVRPALLRLSRTGDVTQPLPVFCRVDGSATPGADYAFEPPLGPFTIPAGAESLEILVIAIDDEQVEETETVVVEITPAPFGAPVDPYHIDPAFAVARVVIHDSDVPPPRPSLVIDRPADGSRFAVGMPIEITATAVDPEGYLPRVEFLDGSEVIGVSEITFIQAPEPGTPIRHEFRWEKAGVGPHVLTARAVTAAGVKVVSAPVHIVVTEFADRVVLAVEASDGEASEPGDATVVDVGVFLIKRVAGPLDVEVFAQYKLTGTAESGADYLPVRDFVVLPPGAAVARVVIAAKPDELREGTETVILTLQPPVCPAIEPPPPGCYLVGEPAEAVVKILDAAPGPDDNQPPRVAILSPASGAVFEPGDTIPVAAAAKDLDGTVARIEVAAGDQVLGSASGAELRVEWKDAPAGLHVLTARATDDDGATAVSAPVRILVREPESLSFVHRSLPPAYAAGHAFTVGLVAEPPRRGNAYAIEDQPPAGWVVGEISEGGAFDAANGKVKFGPFMDREVRRFTYLVTPPAEASGRQEFTGTASLDGKSRPILGDQAIEPAGPFHPAEAAPADSAIQVDELTAYAAAWKAGRKWGTPEESIPLSFVTRAGAIWRAGETYTFDPGAGAPPLCWVPAPPKPTLAGDEPGASGGGRSDREVPDHCVAGLGGAVGVTIQPPEGTRAWAAEEVIPEGWGVSEVSEGGEFDAVARRIRWGLFLGDEARTLAYQLTPPAGGASLGRFSGVVSFDGHVRAINGGRESLALSAGKELRIREVKRGPDGRVTLRLGGEANQLVIVEVSDDLRSWRELAPMLLTGDETDCEDATAPGGPRFYRMRPAGP